MGHKLSTLLARFFCRPTPELRIGMLGLDNAGKTTILYQLKIEQNINPIPTVGFNVETVHYRNLLLNIWDVSGRSRTRQLWEHYNQNPHAIIYVVDAADHRRFAQATEELQWLLRRPQLEHVKLLLFANKQDLPTAVTAEELARIMHMETRHHQWTVQACCAITGCGLFEGLDKLQNMLVVRKK